ncbi:hypothetical protein ACFORL_05500 [Legionella dresdenensis]|uniref:Leucine-rich repeat-containing protein (Substrate of the Dot/Icm secretion system) n=1 Tax=Legionella dresdenensis TaxID=450200 RepID=A0ABV8CEX8_9GAMM
MKTNFISIKKPKLSQAWLVLTNQMSYTLTQEELIAKVEHCDSQVSALSLQNFGLGYRQPKTIVALLEKISSNIITLDLTNNVLSRLSIKEIDTLFQTLSKSSIKHLDLSLNAPRSIWSEEELIAFFSKISRNLESLCLGFYDLASYPANQVKNAFKKLPALQKLDLRNNCLANFKPDELTEILAAQSAPTLMLTTNGFGDSPDWSIAALLQCIPATTKCVNISRNCLASPDAETLKQLAEIKPELQEIIIDSKRIYRADDNKAFIIQTVEKYHDAAFFQSKFAVPVQPVKNIEPVVVGLRA